MQLLSDEIVGSTNFILNLDNKVLYGKSRQELRETYFEAVDQLWKAILDNRKKLRIDPVYAKTPRRVR